MKELDEILKLSRWIKNIDERLEELKQMTQPKAQVISDMPRGGEQKNSIEEYIMKSETLQSKRDYLQELIDMKWDELIPVFVSANITVGETTMLRYRCYSGLPWKKVVPKMKSDFPDQKWNEQKLFRIYRAALCKLDKSKE
jgi:hypothetical protein